MRSLSSVGASIAGFLSLACVLPASAETYYVHYTNASCQVFLTLSTNQVPDGGTLEFTTLATGYRTGYSSPGPVLTVPVDVLLDGEKVSALSAPWSPYGTLPVTSMITNLTGEGSHTVIVRHGSAFEYNTETVYSHSVHHHNPWGADWYDYYYNVYHYRTVPCSDAEGFTVLLSGADFLYATNNGTITITGYTGSGGDVTIPDSINGLPVTVIGADAFNSCTHISGVTISSNVTRIGNQAFSGCSDLASITLCEGVSSIGTAAFHACSSLPDIAIPASVSSFGYNAFGLCHRLQAITVSPLNLSYCSIDGILFDKNMTILIRCPEGKSGDYAIPDGVGQIAAFAFAGTAFNSIMLPSSMTTINEYAFDGSRSLTGLYFLGNAPSTTTEIVPSSTVYRLADATGWPPVPEYWCGRPTALWSPEYQLTVNSGTGSGSYTNGEVVAIAASNPPSGQVFYVWTGATQSVASTTSATTTVTMPAHDISVTATYRADLSGEKAITEFRLTTANSGTLVNGPGWVPGKYGKGLSLANAQYVTVPAPYPDIFNITGDLTIALWVNPNAVTCSGADPAYALVSKRSTNHATPYELYLGNGGSLILHYWGTDIKYPGFAATGTIAIGTWQHVAVTRSFSGTSATVTFYINGLESGRSTAATGPALGSSDPVWISRDGYHTGYTSQGSYSGLMDEVQIYNRALSALEITRVFSNDCALVTGRVGNWRLDEDSGTTVSDTIADGTVDEDAKTVTATVPVGTDVTALVPRITVNSRASINPLSGVAQDFGRPVIYVVTGEDSTSQKYTVGVIHTGSDIDGNGLPDQWELNYLGCIGLDPAALCANGVSTRLAAYIAGFDPTDASACFSITGLDGNKVQWSAVSGRVYSVYWTTNLMDGFQPLETNWTGGTFTDTVHSTEAKCFYKIDVRLAPE